MFQTSPLSLPNLRKSQQLHARARIAPVPACCWVPGNISFGSCAEARLPDPIPSGAGDKWQPQPQQAVSTGEGPGVDYHGLICLESVLFLPGKAAELWKGQGPPFVLAAGSSGNQVLV